MRAIARAGLSRALLACIIASSNGVPADAIPVPADAPPCAPDATASREQSGEAMYARARQAVESEHYPPNVAYVIRVAASENGTPAAADYSAMYRAASDSVRVDPFSAQEAADPHVARGTNVEFKVSISMGGSATIFHRQLNQAERPTDIVGVPQLAPNYTFGIVHRALARDAISPAPATDRPLAVIGSVSARQRTYRIFYAGAEAVGNDVAAHLRLEPLLDPQRNRLRDMWLDPASCLPRKLGVSGNFAGATATVPWTITYQQVAGSTYLQSESADAAVRAKGHTYDRLTISFANIAPRELTPIDELNLDFASKPPNDALREPS